jgi:glycine cleavage system H lipoate-binding protein
LSSRKAASDVYAPVDGEIVEANEALSSDPALLNSAATTTGWLWKMKLADEGQLRRPDGRSRLQQTYRLNADTPMTSTNLRAAPYRPERR